MPEKGWRKKIHVKQSRDAGQTSKVSALANARLEE